METSFEPRIITFVCNWCSYGGADSAGANKLAVPANVRIIRVMCSGRIDPQFILDALEKGADGVLILGCHPGDCHYKEGNYNTLKRYRLMLRMFDQFNIDRERIRLDWVSAVEGEKFSKVTNEFVETVRKLGQYESPSKTLAGSEV